MSPNSPVTTIITYIHDLLSQANHLPDNPQLPENLPDNPDDPRIQHPQNQQQMHSLTTKNSDIIRVSIWSNILLGEHNAGTLKNTVRLELPNFLKPLLTIFSKSPSATHWHLYGFFEI